MSVRDVITGRLMSSANNRFSDDQVADTLQLLVGHGVKRRANAIHIEPHGQYVLVRYRIDGILRGVHKLPKPASNLLTERLKSLADLEPNESYTPQEGHFITNIDGLPVHVRVSIMPILEGEKAVLHLTPEQSSLTELENLGFWGNNLDTLHVALSRPQGLITVAGPKHSGKTATLYSMLHLLNKPGYSIATIEEHSTHRLSGVTQSYVHPRAGASMFKTLEAVLQQDPNIVMISNLPDRPTAELAIHAALGGHLMLAEMHTDGAITSALHLRSISDPPFLLTTALRATVGQRLVRRLCPECRERFALDEARRKKLAEAFGIHTAAARERVAQLERAAKSAGLGESNELQAAAHGVTHVWRARPGGCDHCDHTGYQGRMALTEVLKNDEGIQKRLMTQGSLTAGELHRTALKEGFIPMGLDGLIKALRGLTTLPEVLRAAGPTAI